MSTDAFSITEATRIAPLLDAFPQLEDTLIEMAPPFRKLRNPLLVQRGGTRSHPILLPSTVVVATSTWCL